jgi:hypothetical protein
MPGEDDETILNFTIVGMVGQARLFIIDAFNDNGIGISNIHFKSFGFPLVDGDAELWIVRIKHMIFRDHECPDANIFFGLKLVVVHVIKQIIKRNFHANIIA